MVRKQLRGEREGYNLALQLLRSAPRSSFLVYLVASLMSIFPFLLGTPENAVVFKIVWTQNYSSFTHSLLELFHCTTKLFFTTDDLTCRGVTAQSCVTYSSPSLLSSFFAFLV